MRRLLVILLLFVLGSGYAQRVKYKDIFPMIWTSEEEAVLDSGHNQKP